MPRQARRLVGGVWLFFMLICGLISFPNHYNFRTAGTELAYSLQVMEYHSRGHLVPRLLSMTNPWMDWDDWRTDSHASPSVLTALPFYWIGGPWGLLVHQWLLVGFMAIGFFVYARHRTGLWQAGLWSMIHFFGMWGVTSLLAWDWHELISGIAWLPWAFYAFETKKKWLFILSWALFVGAKENFALWGVWIALLMFVFIYRKSENRKWLFWAGIGALVWFVVSYFLYKGGEKGLSRLNLYAYLAAHDPVAVLQGREPVPSFSFLRVAKTILLRPQLVWTLLFDTPYPEMVGVKPELHWTVLWSGGWSFVFQPVFLLLLLPVYMYKLLSADPLLWGTLYHYGMEFAAMLPIAVLWSAERWRGSAWFWIFLVGGALGAHLMNISLLDSRYSKWYDPERHRWYSPKHYRSIYCYSKIHEGLRIIPREAAVSAVSRLAPHIPPRKEYYHFPACKQAEYIALLRNDPNPWPISTAELNRFIDSLEKSPNWQKVWDRDLLVIFRRRHSFAD
ncbi:MAG: DUF2079 domain-containing protein [Bacteroidia bacterium]